MKEKILITGGLGYIGSHIAVKLLEEGCDVCIVDNLSNSNRNVKNHIEKLAGKPVTLYVADVNNSEKLTKIMHEQHNEIVVHCAGLKSVSESVAYPEKYHDSIYNLSVSVLNAMKSAGVKNIIFSSSATVYGANQTFPLTEELESFPVSPYAQEKYNVEKLLAREPEIKALVFRYFNVLGADESGLIGDKPTSNYVNLIKELTDKLTQNDKTFYIAGNDRNTADGTAMRDYIHVKDIASAHELAIKNFDSLNNFELINLCGGKPVSVLNIFEKYNAITGRKMKVAFKQKRQGDVDISYGSFQKAKMLLNWTPKYNIDQMLASHFNFVKLNNLLSKEDKKEKL